MHDDDELETFERIRRSWQDQSGTMPVGADGARRRGRKQTHKSRRVSKLIGQQTGGLRKRRRKGNHNDLGS